MSISERHHFLPMFYLKRFTNDDGRFYIYDVNKKSLRASGQLFYPSQQFYKYKSNTVSFDTIESDFIEEAYGDIDSKVSAILHKVHSVESTLTQHEITLLQYFVNVLYWRNPVNEDKIKAKLLNANSLGEFGMKLMKKDTVQKASVKEEQILLERMKADTDTFKLLKVHMPAQTYSEIFEKEIPDYATIIDFQYDTHKLISDNPIIYRNPEMGSLHIDEFIFPLSPKKWLFRHKVPKIITHTAMKFMIDLMGLIQAKEYVATTNKEYPMILQDYYDKHFSSINEVRERAFRFVIDATQIKTA